MPHAKSFLYKNLDYLKTIESTHFTNREIEILSCLIHGRSASKIANLLSIAPKTVENHTHNIMAKIGCNSREGVLDFIERSGKIQLLRQYYANLLVYEIFEQKLKQVSQLNKKDPIRPLVVIGKNDNLRKLLFELLELHLKIIGIPLKIRKSRGENLTDFSFSLGENATLEFATLDLEDENNYYYAFFSILQNLIYLPQLEEIVLDFKKSYEKIASTQNQFQVVVNTQQNDNREANKAIWRRIAISVAFLILASGMALFFSPSHFLSPLSESFVRSTGTLPHQSTLLFRPELINQIEQAFRKGIHVIALVGIGGAGKTTLARQYASQSHEKVVWELNAETPESLLVSFEDLAYSLANTIEGKNNLTALQEIKDPHKRGKQITEFVKDRLKNNQNWLLVYDNVSTMENLKDHFPADSKTWGNGKVILTTQDSTIGNNHHVDDVIHIAELADDQKENIFISILHGSALPSPSELARIKAFLKNIPSFPLDVCVAAYYLKFGNISFDEYLNSLQQNYKDFEAMQHVILKDTGDYVKTRYSIIRLSLKKLIETHKDFNDLLLFISLLDSQKIPRELLNQYKSKHIVDNFIYHLSKYSLLCKKLIVTHPHTISFHRSVQRIILAYLMHTLPPEKKDTLLNSIARSLNSYMHTLIEEENYPKMQALLTHYDTLTSHQIYLSPSLQARFHSQLGTVFYLLGNYAKSKESLEMSLLSFDKQNPEDILFHTQALDYLGLVYKNFEDYEKAKNFLEANLMLQEKSRITNTASARTLSFLGSIYRYLGEYNKAKITLEKSLALYKQHETKDFAGLSRCLSYLGEIYRVLGDYKNAKLTLEESLKIFKKIPKNPLRHARVLGELGRVYRILGEYDNALKVLTESYKLYEKHLSSTHEDTAWAAILLASTYEDMGYFDKAKTLLEKSLAIYKKGAADHSIPVAWVSSHLANTLLQLGSYEEARILFQNSLDSYKHHLPEDNIEVNQISSLLASSFIKLGKLELAKSLLQKALKVYERSFGKDHFENAYLLLELGDIELQRGDFSKAEKYFRKAEFLFKTNNHPSIYLAFEHLADLYLRQGNQRPQENSAKTMSYLNLALGVAKKHFPADSQHVQRIQSKIGM